MSAKLIAARAAFIKALLEIDDPWEREIEAGMTCELMLEAADDTDAATSLATCASEIITQVMANADSIYQNVRAHEREWERWEGYKRACRMVDRKAAKENERLARIWAERGEIRPPYEPMDLPTLLREAM